ncbi:MAG: hypothetical protein IKT84_02840 [Bacteroidales bacterium]|nr:hypothetical protein [Bacteroidales bacterium]
MKQIKILTSCLSIMMLLASCTSKEDKLRDYVNNILIERVEDYLISETVINYIQENALQAGLDKANYYYDHFDHDWSYSERLWSSSFIHFSKATGELKEIFDNRVSSYYDLIYSMSHAGGIYSRVRAIMDSTFRFTSLLKRPLYLYSLDEITDIYFRPNHTKFIDTKDYYDEFFWSLVCLGGECYEHDVVDDIRIRNIGKNELGNNQWNVDLVYHSRKCIQLTIAENGKEFDVIDPLWQYSYPEDPDWKIEESVIEELVM